MAVVDRGERTEKVAASMVELHRAHDHVGGAIVSSGGTGTYDLHPHETDVQAGSYLLMDTYYNRLSLPFRQALFVAASVISVQPKWIVCDAGLKSLGMDHGNPSIAGATVWFCSDEHVTYALEDGTPAPKVGDRVLVTPAHVDPTMAMHERVYLVESDEVVDTIAIDLRGW